MNLYATLEQVQQQAKAGQSSISSTNADLEELKRALHTVSRRIDRLMFGETYKDRQAPYFSPTVGTFTFPFTNSWIDHAGFVFAPGVPIQAVTTVTLKHRQYSEALTSSVAVTDDKRLEWTTTTGSFWAYTNHYGFGAQLEVVGTIGWVNDWLDSGDTVQDNPLSDSATTITVNDADGSNLYFTGQRFSYGVTIRVESEIMHVTAVDTDTNTLTVLRGQNGTTAASHLQGTMIEVLRIPEPVQHATARQAGMLYTRRGAFQSVTTGLDGATTVYPQDLLQELRAVLAEYQV